MAGYASTTKASKASKTAARATSTKAKPTTTARAPSKLEASAADHQARATTASPLPQPRPTPELAFTILTTSTNAVRPHPASANTPATPPSRSNYPPSSNAEAPFHASQRRANLHVEGPSPHRSSQQKGSPQPLTTHLAKKQDYVCAPSTSMIERSHERGRKGRWR